MAMQKISHHTLPDVVALPSHSPMISRRIGYAMATSLQRKKLNLSGIDRIKKLSVFVNLIITNLCLILAVFLEPKALFLSTAILAALASGLGILIISHCKNNRSTAEICVLGMFIVYITFFTLVAAATSVLSISFA